MAESLHEMAKRVCLDNRSCADCPLRGTAIPYSGTVSRCAVRYIKVEGDRVEKAIGELRAWAAANPVRTYKDDFFEKFPNAPRGGKGYEQYPTANLYTVYPVCKEKDKEFYADTSDRDAWDKPLGYWNAPLGTWGEKAVPDERTPPDNGDAACMSCRYEECDVYQEPCLKCVHGEGKTENYHASAAEMERRQKG